LRKTIYVGSAALHPGDVFLIAGPCVIEDEAITFETAERLKTICAELSISFVF